GTPFCLLPVSSLNDVPIGRTPMGQVTRQILDRWSANVGLDIESQIKLFNEETTDSAGASPYRFKK
ncbi:MAG: branched-chain amino acid aminotransferase, partial [Limisphaerales bacterium]